MVDEETGILFSALEALKRAGLDFSSAKSIHLEPGNMVELVLEASLTRLGSWQVRRFAGPIPDDPRAYIVGGVRWVSDDAVPIGVLIYENARGERRQVRYRDAGE